MTTGVDAKTCKLVVLDQNIQSMTKFKQIIGRGTRIDDRYNKLWFTILDFKKATELFADEKFDGPPEQVMVTKPETIIDTNDPSFDDEMDGANAYDDTERDDGGVEHPTPDYTPGPDSDGPWEGEESEYLKYRVCGVTVKKVAERVQYYDTNGKLVTESFKDYTRNTIKKQFATMDEFIKKWQGSERKQAVIDELANEGVIWEALQDDVSRDMDPFDLICHVAFDQPPLTRKERADNVKKRNYFGKYSETAQIVLNTQLDKYADSGVTEIESRHVLKVTPFDKMGRPLEIVKSAFGSKANYEQAISDLEHWLYAENKDSA